MPGCRVTKRRVTLGADKAYDVADIVDALRDRVTRVSDILCKRVLWVQYLV